MPMIVEDICCWTCFEQAWRAQAHQGGAGNRGARPNVRPFYSKKEKVDKTPNRLEELRKQSAEQKKNKCSEWVIVEG